MRQQGQSKPRRPGGNRGIGRPSPRQHLDSNGPSIRIRGTAAQIYDKYISLARDAAGNGDWVLSENLLQHAEHYNRLMNDEGVARPPSLRRGASAINPDDPQPDIGGAVARQAQVQAYAVE